MSDFLVLKLDIRGQETWRYTGELLERGQEFVVVQASFNRQDLPFHGILLRQGDRFVETFYSDRWYNVFEIYDKDDDCLKGWYCNICRPAEMDHNSVSYIDLGLDLLVYPDGSQLILDEDEFEALDLDEETRQQARQGLQTLQEEFRKKTFG
jgi:uncharacterized protein